MLAIGTGETITDGVDVYVLTSDHTFKLVAQDGKADHRVEPEVMAILLGQNGKRGK